MREITAAPSSFSVLAVPAPASMTTPPPNPYVPMIVPELVTVVPARVLTNALSLNADAVILALEDAVATAEKCGARGAVVAARALPCRSLLYVRVNAVDTAATATVAVVRPGLDDILAGPFLAGENR